MGLILHYLQCHYSLSPLVSLHHMRKPIQVVTAPVSETGFRAVQKMTDMMRSITQLYTETSLFRVFT